MIDRKLIEQTLLADRVHSMLELDLLRLEFNKQFYDRLNDLRVTKRYYHRDLQFDFNNWTITPRVIYDWLFMLDYLDKMIPIGSRIYEMHARSGMIASRLAKSGKQVRVSELSDQKIQIIKQNAQLNNCNIIVDQSFSVASEAMNNSYDYMIYNPAPMYSFIRDPITEGDRIYATADYKFQRLESAFKKAQDVLKEKGLLVLAPAGMKDVRVNAYKKTQSILVWICNIFATEYGFVLDELKEFDHNRQGDKSYSAVMIFRRADRFQSLQGIYPQRF